MELKPSVEAINVTIDNNKIVYVRLNAGFNISLNDIQTTFLWAVNEMKPNKFNAMVVGSQGISFDPDARDYLKSEEFQKHIDNYSLIVANFGQQLLVDFLFKLQKPLFEYKVFTSEEKAKQWLLKKGSQ